MMNTESLSHAARTVLLARLAHALTICARSTYEPGTENILEPAVLRGYNELLHRVTASVCDHLEGSKEFPLEAILEMLQEFGTSFNRTDEMYRVLKMAQESPLLSGQ